VWGRWQNAIEDEIENASTRAVEYAVQFENPVIVLEYLEGITEEDIGKYWNRRLGKWLFSRLQSRIEDKAAGAAFLWSTCIRITRRRRATLSVYRVSTASGHVPVYE